MSEFERPEPPLTERTGDYWRSGADGTLRILTCRNCGWRLHPPRPVCPKCRRQSLRFDPVSGRGVVHSFTINRYAWFPTMPPPFVIAEVELEEQEGLRITTAIVGCPAESVAVGMRVTVDFEHVGEAWIPVFRP